MTSASHGDTRPICVHWMCLLMADVMGASSKNVRPSGPGRVCEAKDKCQPLDRDKRRILLKDASIGARPAQSDSR